VLDAFVRAHDADLLVMGAYGHSRVREFVLGGATKSVLARPSVPTLLSH
jgi:nucleotide-binding universal stress UspA family protein